MDEIKDTTQVDISTTTENVAPSNETTGESNDTVYKVFNTEDELKKFEKSSGQKRISQLYKELGVESIDQLKGFIDTANKYHDLESKYTEMESKYKEYEAAIEASSKEKEALNRQLVLNKLNISDDKEIQDDFIAGVNNLMTRKNIDFESAASEYAAKYPMFRKSIVNDSIKIGVDRTNSNEEPISGVEKAFAKLNSWYKSKN